MNSKELATKTGRNLRWIQKIAPRLLHEKLGRKMGGMYLFHEEAVEYINENFGRRGKCVKA